MEASLKEKAAFLRLGLSLGIVDSREAIQLADQAIERSDNALPGLLDLSTTDPADVLAVIDALSVVAGSPLSEPPPPATIRALLDIVRGDLFAGRRDLPEAVELVDRLSHFVDVNDNFRWELAALADDYAVVKQGLGGDLPTVSTIAREFLAQFDGASTGFRVRAA